MTTATRHAHRPAPLARRRGGARLALTLLLCALGLPARGQTVQATLVKDIQPGTFDLSIHPFQLTGFQGRLYFGAQHPWVDDELWTSDGTVAGTHLLADVQPTIHDLSPRDLTPVGPTLFFAGRDLRLGNSLWKTDGTPTGTVPVAAPGGPSYAPGNLTDVAGTLFFTVFDDDLGDELWKSDGTSAGTVLVKDIRPGEGSSSPEQLTAVGSTLYFLTRDPADRSHELWKSDGTASGTVRVGSIVFAPWEEPSLTAVNGALFFVHTDAAHGMELWTTDGVATTVLDLVPGSQGSEPGGLVDFNGVLFFNTRFGPGGSFVPGGFWRSDGTPGGTFRVLESDRPGWLTPVGPTLFMVLGTGEEGTELWKSDGTPSGTVLVKDIVPGADSSYPTNLIDVSGTLFFTAGDYSTLGLWKSDGTAAGTVQVVPLNPGGLIFEEFAAAGGYLFFRYQEDGLFARLWRSDGTAAGTFPLTGIQIPRPSEPLYLTASGSRLFLRADDGLTGVELWQSDGTGPGTSLVQDLHPAAGSFPNLLTPMGGLLYFTVYDSVGFGIWSTDGTAGGTALMTPASPQGMIAAGTTLYFDRADASGRELWKSDGTAAGTVLVKDIFPGGDSNPSYLTPAGGQVYFAASSAELGNELWKTDGTAAGTVPMRDINPGSASSSPVRLAVAGSTVFFAAHDEAHGRELWKTDGTPAGTVLVKDIVPGPGSSQITFEAMATVGSLVFFAATDGVTGLELWRSDGTAAGTILLKDISPDPFIAPGLLTRVGGQLFFTADDGVHGRELWKSDGTPAGTTLVKDILPGATGSDPTGLVDGGGVAYFRARDLPFGEELWRSDGTAAGTVLAADVAPGPMPSSPHDLAVVGGQLFFAAAHESVGDELWRIPIGRTLAAADLTVLEGTGGAASAVVTVTLSAPSTGTVSVNLATADGTATSPADYAAFSGPLVFAPGETSRTVAVPLVADAVDEPDETFSVVLTGPSGAVLGDGQARVTIRDDDGPSITIADVAVSEGSVGPTTAILTVALSAPSLQSVSLSYGTASGTAAAQGDYVPRSGRLDFLPGATGLTVTIPVVADTMDEFDETFLVNLSNPQNATLADAQAVVTIVDDDAPPSVGVGDVLLLEGSQGTQGATFGVALSAASGKTVGVSFATRNGSATAGSDYVGGSGPLSFPPGTTARTVTVNVNGDTDVEPDETFFVDLSSPVNATLGDAEGQATILDDDQARAFHTVTPCRLVDTRNPPGPSGGPALAANTSRTFPVAGRCAIPASARAVAVSITAVNAGAVGDFRLYPAGSRLPLASALNFVPGRTRAGNGVIPLGGGQVSVQCDMPVGSTAAVHFVLDVYGYFE